MRNADRLYRIWDSMKGRCYRKSHANYRKYGEKGISVCDAWHKFKNFQRWALCNGYSDELTLDSICYALEEYRLGKTVSHFTYARDCENFRDGVEAAIALIRDMAKPERNNTHTNADRMRGMSDEELARFLWEQNGGNRYWKSVEKYLDWLKQPVKEEEYEAY